MAAVEKATRPSPAVLDALTNRPRARPTEAANAISQDASGGPNRDAIIGEAHATFGRLSANPVTPSVYNEAFLTGTLLHEQAAGREVALLLSDSNGLTEYNAAAGLAAGDEAIEQTSQAMNSAALRLNRLHEDLGISFLPGRKAGDEMFLLAVLDPAATSAATLPATVPQDMVRVLNEEIASYNASHAMPIPTATSSTAVIKPGSFAGPFELASLMNQIDHAGPALLNTPGASPWYKNGGVVLGDGGPQLMPGPTYQTPGEGQLLGFRLQQGGLPDPSRAYALGRPNVVGLPGLARPQLIPGQAPSPASGRAELPPALLTSLSGTGAADPVDALNTLRAQQPIESVFRPLMAEGISVHHQPVGLARLQYMMDAARAAGASVALEFMEPRGLKEVNDLAFAKVGGPRVTDAPAELNIPVSHGGGSRVIEAMVRANHQALSAILGPGYEDAGHACTFRDRGKRFANVYGPEVSGDAIRQVQQLRDELYRAMPATVAIGGVERQILMPSPEGGRPFAFSSAAVALQVSPRTATQEDALSLRERLVAPVEPTGTSVLDAAKLMVDGEPAPPGVMYAASPGLDLFFTDTRRIPPNQASGQS